MAADAEGDSDSDLFAAASQDGEDWHDRHAGPAAGAAAPSGAASAAGSSAHLYVFTNSKAGMDGCDRALQLRVIEELSRGSAHLEHAKRKDARADQRVRTIRERVAALQQQPRELARQSRLADAVLAKAEERSRSGAGRWCCVVDMDMYFAAVAQREDPSLVDRPFAIGGMGMLSTANYVARRYGVRAAMPGFIARELCRRQGVELTFVRTDFAKYAEVAEEIREVIARFGRFRAYSLDEAYVDLTPAVRERAAGAADEGPAAEQVLSEMRRAIKERTRLTASAGLAPNFMLAKVAADVNKPDGQFIVPRDPHALREWWGQLPLRKIPGVGRVTEKIISESLGLRVCADAVGEQRGLLYASLTPRMAEFILTSAAGVAASELHDYSSLPEGAVTRKSIGAERTFGREGDPDELRRVLTSLCTRVAEDMASHGGLRGRTVCLKLKRTNFDVSTRQAATPDGRYLHTASDLAALAMPLLQAQLPCELRLMGVRVTHFKGQVADGAANSSQGRLTAFAAPRRPPAPAADAPVVCSPDSDSDVVVISQPRQGGRKRPAAGGARPAARRRQRPSGADVEVIEID